MTVKESVAAWLNWRRRRQPRMSLESRLTTIVLEDYVRYDDALRVAELLMKNHADRARLLKPTGHPTPVHKIAHAVEAHLHG